MPIYEYRCEDCARRFETFVRPGRDEAECPSCHGANLARELSVFASGSPSREASNGNAVAASADAPFKGSPCCGGACGCR
jgi:putative FmdB family regulatory protein